MEASEAPIRRGRRGPNLARDGKETTCTSSSKAQGFKQSEFDPCYFYKKYLIYDSTAYGLST
eukprot:1856113-Pleurochrysis_carterae.AAC.1